MNVMMKRAGFRYLLRMTAEALFARRATIAVEGGDGLCVFKRGAVDALITEALAFDDCLLIAGDSWVKFVWSNDPGDCISDYTTNLEEAMKPISDVAEKIDQGDFEIVVKS